MSKLQENATPTIYDLGIKALDVSIRRFDNQDSNLEKIITWVGSFSTGLITLIGSGKLVQHVDYGSPLFTIGVGFGLASIAVAFVGKFFGEIAFPNPKRIHEEDYCEDTTELFMRDHIYFFGENCDEMDNATKRKWQFGVTAILLFCFELIALVTWVVRSPTS